jgi:MFS transporter, FSR family, fosmidomycin resistance protein
MQNTTTAELAPRWMERWPPQRRNLAAACLAHFLHDGYTDQLYALLPVWQPEFGLSYAGLALVLALYSGTMGILQLPADRLMVKLGARAALAIATFVAAAGYLVVALPLGLPGLCVGLILAGVGSSLQHPRASLMVTTATGRPREGLSAFTTSRAIWERRPFRRWLLWLCPSWLGGPSWDSPRSPGF